MKYEIRNMKSEGRRLGLWIEFLLVAAIALLGIYSCMEDGFGQTQTPTPNPFPVNGEGEHENASGQAVFGPQREIADTVVGGPLLREYFPTCTPDSLKLIWRADGLTAVLWLEGEADTVVVWQTGTLDSPAASGGNPE